jgi:hypothetical protein
VSVIDNRKPCSCMDQFDRVAESEHVKDGWSGKLSVRLLALMNRVTRKL